MRDRTGRRLLAALVVTYAALALVFVFVYGGGLKIGALAMLEMLAMLALAAGVAWAASNRH